MTTSLLGHCTECGAEIRQGQSHRVRPGGRQWIETTGRDDGKWSLGPRIFTCESCVDAMINRGHPTMVGFPDPRRKA